MTCAKRRVDCMIHTQDGLSCVIGTNNVLEPQEVCPREPGEGYDKCLSICKQPAHAEIAALVVAAHLGIDVRNGTAVIYGHDRCCPHCKEQLGKVGILDVRFGE